MNEEQKMGLGFLVALVVIVGVGALASMQKTSLPAPVTDINSLPLTENLYWDNIAPETCEAAGGTMKYERTTDCHASPSPRDFCSPLLLCFDDRSNSVCYETKRPYCACESDAQCPDGYICDGKGPYRACHQR